MHRTLPTRGGSTATPIPLEILWAVLWKETPGKKKEQFPPNYFPGTLPGAKELSCGPPAPPRNTGGPAPPLAPRVRASPLPHSRRALRPGANQKSLGVGPSPVPGPILPTPPDARICSEAPSAENEKLWATPPAPFSLHPRGAGYIIFGSIYRFNPLLAYSVFPRNQFSTVRKIPAAPRLGTMPARPPGRAFLLNFDAECPGGAPKFFLPFFCLLFSPNHLDCACCWQDSDLRATART